MKFHRGAQVLVSFGSVSPHVLKIADIKQDVFYAEINIDLIEKAKTKTSFSFSEIPKYPSSRRDLALVVDQSIKYSDVEKIIKKSAGSLLKDVFLFDIYQNEKHLGKGKKSYAVGVIFEDKEKNLKDKVLDKILKKALTQMDSELGASLR